MLARIIDDKTIKFEQITTAEEVVLNKEFSVQDPRARYIDTSEGNFDGWYRKYNSFHKKMSRALLGELRKVCDSKRLPLHIVDDRPPPKYPAPDVSVVTPDLLPGITLPDYQIRSIAATCQAEVGLIEVPTGGGKGELIAGITKIMNCPTVIIAEQKVVLSQLKERLELRKVVEEVGMFMAGKRPNGQTVIVGSIDSLLIPPEPEKTETDTPEKYAKKLKAFKTRRKNARILRQLVNKCDLLMVDEADKATSKKYNHLFKYWFNGRRKYGFSGTFFDPSKPVQNLKLKENLGSVIAHATRDEVQSLGRIIPVEYCAIAFGDPEKKSDKTAHDIAIKEQTIENAKYHELIKRLALKSIERDGYGTLILAESVPLGLELEKIIPGSKYIYGSTGIKARNAAIKAFENRELRILIGSKILRRGLDLKGGCETLIIATDVQMWSEFNQMIGRSVRLNQVGKAKVYGIFHLGNYYLYKHSRDCLKHIVGMGYPAKVIFPHTVVEAEQFINSRFRLPKRK